MSSPHKDNVIESHQAVLDDPTATEAAKKHSEGQIKELSTNPDIRDSDLGSQTTPTAKDLGLEGTGSVEGMKAVTSDGKGI